MKNASPARKSGQLIVATLSLILAGCMATGPAVEKAPASAPESAQAALRPYYAQLHQSLPQAPANPDLPGNVAITRFAFGSCVNENRDMAFWDIIAAQDPQAFLMIGDNVYGDVGTNFAADMPSLSNSYRKLNSRQEFDRFRRKIPMLTMWDDHDFGAKDGGGTFAFKEYSETIYENYWNAPDHVRNRPGVYDARITGPKGKRVQFILLDSRFFRSDIMLAPYRNPPPPLGNIIPDTDPASTMLGGEQWRWLEQQLEKPAELRFIISSVQVISTAHGYESWYNFPKEREKLFNLLARKNAGNAIFLSGDRHSGAFYRTEWPGIKSPLWELTSSSLNLAYGTGDSGAREPDADRTGGLWSIENFGQVDIDWANRQVRLTLKKTNGEIIEEQIVRPFD